MWDQIFALDGNWLYLLVASILYVSVTLINNGYLSKALKGKGNGKGKSLADIAECIDGLKHDVGKLSVRIGHVDKLALKGMIYNTNKELSIAESLEAFDCYLRLDGNGKVFEYAVKNLVIPHWEVWLREQEKNDMEIYYSDKYAASIAEIKRIKERGTSC